MENQNLLTIFVALTGAAVVLQAGVLAAIYLAMRKSTARMEALAEEVKTKVLPTVDTVQASLVELRPKVQSIADAVVELRPKLQSIADNLIETTGKIRAQVERTDATVSDIVDRARLQVVRADELLTRTLDRVEETSEMVHKTVVSPVRQLSGLMHGITAGVEFLLGNRGRRNGRNDARRPVPQDEMFI